MSVKKGSLCRDVYSFSGRKGQVTVFIIIGIVILFTFAAILYLTQTSVKDDLSIDANTIISSAPAQFNSIKLFTENCISSVAKTGLVLLGQQGGYIYPDLVGEFSQTKVTEADGLTMGSSSIPYWFYNNVPNEGEGIVFTSLQPDLSVKDNPEMSIEAQLARYVQENIVECLGKYEVFEQQAFVFDLNENKRTVETKITDNSVNFLLEMPFEVSKGGVDGSFSKFFVKVPINLKHYYEVADQITTAQKEYSFLERQGMELISVYSAKDSQKLAPISDVGYQLFSPYSWHEIDLEKKIKDLLTSYVPLLQFLGSRNFYYTTFPEGNLLAQAVVDNMVLTLQGADDVNVNFDYFGWDVYFDVNSDDRGMVKPVHTFINYQVLNFGHQQYETHYDVSYPVLVTVKDESGIDGKPYSFVFALESNIRNNAPAESGEFLEKYPRKIASLACNEEHRDTGLLKTVVVDSFTKEPVDLVRLGFTIPQQAECEMGFTDGTGELETEYPSTYGGVINFIKEDYLTNFYPIDTYKHKDSDAILGYAIGELPAPAKVIEMHKYKDINVRVKKKVLKKCVTPLLCEYTTGTHLLLLPYNDISCETGEQQCFFDANGVFGGGQHVASFESNGSISKYSDYYFVDKEIDLTEDEEALLTLERIGGFHDEIVSQEFFSTVNVKGEEVISVRLVPGIYKVGGIVTLMEESSIPAEDRCFNYDILTWEQDECYTLDENKFNSYIAGNMDWDTSASYLVITPEQLYTAENLTMYVVTQDIESIPEKFEAPSKKCGGFLCVSDVCAFEQCKEEMVSVSGKVIEDLQVPNLIGDISKSETVRPALEPMFS